VKTNKIIKQMHNNRNLKHERTMALLQFLEHNFLYQFIYAILQVAEGCKLQGASRIIGIDLNPCKFELGTNYLILKTLLNE
jgi:hypothetical protein